MSFEGKTPLALLILVVSFLYIAFGANVFSENTPLAFGKMIKRVVFDNNENRAEVIFVGDVLLARDVERRLKVVGPGYPFINVNRLFDGNFVFGNFEAAVPKLHQPTPDLNTKFSVKSENLDALVAGKFTHWSLANNHTFDFDTSGYEETIQQLSLRGFDTFGHPEVISSSSLTRIVVNKQEISVIAINAVTKDPDKAALSQLIQAAKKQNDLVVVYIHWGDEYKSIHNYRQENLAHLMIDLGVDLVIGHHPHVVQDIELYKSRLIVYSLGNFVFDQYFSNEVQQGLAVSLLPRDNELIISLMPVSSLNSKIQPRFLEGSEKVDFLEDLAKRSSESISDAIIRGEIELIF